MTRSHRYARPVAALAMLAAASVALSGCLYTHIPTTSSSSSPGETKAPATDGVSDDLMEYYGQQITWDSCSTGFECTTVTAPLDWSDPGGDTIDLAVIRQPATGTSKGSLLTNPGGPGASGVNFLIDSGSYIFNSD
ncbi:MAG: alpha/beta hydrolase, partial [Microbacterium sp.]